MEQVQLSFRSRFDILENVGMAIRMACALWLKRRARRGGGGHMVFIQRGLGSPFNKMVMQIMGGIWGQQFALAAPTLPPPKSTSSASSLG